VPTSKGDLQLQQDLKFQNQEWLFQRIGRIVLTFFVVAAALGLFGSGPLSRARVDAPTAEDNPGAASVEYERFLRISVPTRLSLRFSQFRAPEKETVIEFNREYYDSVFIRQISPQPSRVTIDQKSARFYYAARAELPADRVLIFVLVPRKFGSLPLRIRADQLSTSLRLFQFVYF